jgi:hypothetical protein
MHMVQEGIECIFVNFASELMIGQWTENNCIVGEVLARTPEQLIVALL